MNLILLQDPDPFCFQQKVPQKVQIAEDSVGYAPSEEKNTKERGCLKIFETAPFRRINILGGIILFRLCICRTYRGM